MKTYKFLISGGGTGGHIFPAIAIANSLKKRFENSQIEFVGANDRMEMEKVPAAGYKIHGLTISGFQRSFSVKNLFFPFKVVKSIIDCYFILKKFMPDIVIGTGGFASGPLLKVATWLNIPTLIQEQNSFAGVTNKILGNKVSSICIGFEKAKVYFPQSNTIFTGNPVRQNIINLPEREIAYETLNLDKTLKTILIIGGSLGAKSINEAVENSISKFNDSKIQLIWQTGKNYESTSSPKYGVKLKFIENMEYAYSASDLIISRAGAIAISELCLVGKPTILVPSPNVAEDHQTKNAKALTEKNAAILVKDNEIIVNIFNKSIELLNDENQKSLLSSNIKKMGMPEATENIVNEIEKLLKN